MKIDLFLEPKPGVPPTPTHLAEVITKMKQDKVHVIIVDPYLNRRTAETVAAQNRRDRRGRDAISRRRQRNRRRLHPLMDYLVNSIAKALAGK